MMSSLVCPGRSCRRARFLGSLAAQGRFQSGLAGGQKPRGLGLGFGLFFFWVIAELLGCCGGVKRGFPGLLNGFRGRLVGLFGYEKGFYKLSGYPMVV